MAQSEHVLLTRFDLITWARCQGGSGGKLYYCIDNVQILTSRLIFHEGKKKSPFSVLTRYKLLAHSQLGKVRETNYVWVHKAALRELILPSCHAGCSEKQMLFRLNWKI